MNIYYEQKIECYIDDITFFCSSLFVYAYLGIKSMIGVVYINIIKSDIPVVFLSVIVCVLTCYEIYN